MRVVAAAAALSGAALASAGGCGLDSSGNPPEPTTTCEDAVECADAALCTIDGCSDDASCTHAAAPNGEAPLQVPGDCLRITCEGGVDQPNADPTDADDGNPCTADSCSGGKEEHKKLDDVACMLGETAGTCVAGECVVPCTDSAMCDDGQPCTIDTCDLSEGSGTCSYQANHGALVSNASDDDCVLIVCSGKVEVTVADDGEIPDDLNPCTDDACVGGLPSHPPASPGGPCGAAGKCDGQGNCVGCLDAYECPGVDDACQYRTCSGGVCGTEYQPFGASGGLPQTPGDCTLVVCDGGGGTTPTQDDSDKPPDEGNPCTSEECSGGYPSWQPVDVDTPCPGGVCSATGLCVQCNSPMQCPPGDACNGTACTSNTCWNPPLDAGAAPDGDCPPEAAATCGRTGHCDGAGECELFALGTVCAPGTCIGGEEMAAMTCSAAYSCGGGGGKAPCAPYVCGPTACQTSCTTELDCTWGYYCSSSACTPKLVDGTPCSAATQCASGSCADGVCCNSPCGELCKACVGSKTGGSDGTCANIPPNSDPDNECQAAANPVCCGGACGPAGCT